MVKKRLDAERVFLIGTSSELVVRMLGQIVFIWLERSDTTQLQNAFSAIQHSQFIHRSQLFATKSSGEFPKGKRHKRNPSFISLAFLFCFDIIYGITLLPLIWDKKKQETFSDFPLSKTVKFF